MPEMIILPALFLTIGFVVWTTVTTLRQRHRLRVLTDFNAKVIDRLGSVHDFTEFAKSEAGARFLDGVIAEEPKLRPGERILRAAQVGIILVMLAAGLLSLAGYFDRDARNAFIVVGVIALSLGGGFLISAIASHRISIALGLGLPTTKVAD